MKSSPCAENTLVSSPLTADEILDNVRPLVFVLDQVGTILQVCGSPIELVGYAPPDLIGRNALEFVAERHYDQMMFVFAGPGGHVVADRHAPFPLELLGADAEPMLTDCAAQRVHKDGEISWVVTLSPHAFQSASFHATVAFGHKATSAEVAATIAERLSWKWDEASTIRSFVLNDVVDGRFSSVTEPARSSSSSFGRTEANSNELHQALAEQVDTDAVWNANLASPYIVVPVRRLPSAVAEVATDAGFVVASIAIARVEGQPHIGFVSFGIHDNAFEGNESLIISESIATLEMTIRREQSDQILRRHADEDPLTGLSNRRAFDAAVTDHSPATSALLYIDLDRFKAINDTHGHAIGDQVLIEVSRRIHSMCRPDDVIARLGGDEFAVLLTGVDADTAAHVAQRILTAIGQPLPPGMGPDRVEASGGLAMSSIDHVVDHLLDAADMAMLDGKRSGTAQLVIV